MKIQAAARFLTFLATMALASTTVANPAVLNFDEGLSTTAVDGYPGVAGDGWDTPWIYNSGTETINVSTTDPLSAGSGAYLDVTSTGLYHTVSRKYGNTETFNPLSDHTISWEFRLDDDFVFDDTGDRIHCFGNGIMAPSTSSSNSWCIGVAPKYMGFNNWYFYNATEDSTFTPANAIDTGMSLQTGTTYNMSVSIRPLEGTYDATISNGQTSYTQANLNYRNGSTSTSSPWLNFGGTNNARAGTLSYSIDSVEISGGSADVPDVPLPRADGFKGIWYYNQAIDSDYVYKYSGGFATYPQQIRPMAHYSETADKTFFVYGGTNASNSTIYHCISYYDHQTGQVAQPRVLLNKYTTDAHDNPCMVLDDEGYIYIFSNSHGTGRPSFVNRSTEPYSIDSFDTVLELPGDNNFSYGQPLYVQGQGFIFLHTLYTGTGRTLCYNTSSDGITWDYDWEERPMIAQMPTGQYQVSQVCGQTVGTAFNYHPGGNVNRRTNLYYMETDDMGQTWTTADGTSLTTPVTSITSAALVHDYAAEDRLVYMKDIQYDADGQPVIMYLTSEGGTDGWIPGPQETPRMFHVAHYDEGQWVIKDLFTCDHNYDYGQLTIEDDGTWRIIAPTDPGPQAYGTGGEMIMWLSEDEGDTWNAIRDLTYDSEYNHTYAKQPVGANDDFYAFWADGDAFGKSESSLYFTDKDGTGVWRLPYDMDTDFATPELAYTPKVNATPGDANEDGVVDGSDVTILANNWQHGVGMEDPDATWWMGDFNGDGVVDGSDVTILANNWQEGVANTQTAVASVPEPSTWTLLCTLLLLLILAFPSRIWGCVSRP